MSMQVKTRYGGLDNVRGGTDLHALVEGLIHELETEQFDKPDDEHYQVALVNQDWSVTVCVSGLAILDDLGWITTGAEKRSDTAYRRLRSREEAVKLLTA